MSKEKSALPHKEHVVLGMSAAVGAFLMFTVMNMFAKMLSVNHSVIEIAFYRNLVGVGLSGAAAQWLLTFAFRNAKAAIITVFNYSSIVWATLFGWMIWNEWPLPAVMLGAAIVIASNILMIWRESRLDRISDARFRAKL